VVVSDPLYYSERTKLQALLNTARLPVVTLREQVVAGGLLSYGVALVATLCSAAKYVDKILKGAKPADLPVEQATKFEGLNLRPERSRGTFASFAKAA
jgi:putative ABC transport system substrate-binding protein